MIYLTGIVSAFVCSVLCVVCIYDWKKVMQKEQTEKNIMGKKMLVALCSIIMIISVLLSILFNRYGYGPLKSIKYCCLLWGLAPIAFRDWKTKTIPNRWLAYLIGIRLMLLVLEVLFYPDAVWDNLMFLILGTFISGGIMFLAYVISRHEIGMGDVKLFMVTGMYLGLSLNYLLLLASLIFSAVYGCIKMMKKDLKSKDSIPFAPFVFMGAIVILGLGF